MALDIGSLRIAVEVNTKAVRDLQKDMKNLTAVIKSGADVQVRSAQKAKKALAGQAESVKKVDKAAKTAASSAERLARAELRQAKALATARDKAKELSIGLKVVGGAKEDINRVNSALGTFVSSIRKAEGNTTKLAKATFRFKENTKGAKKALSDLNKTAKEKKGVEAFTLATQDLTKSVQLALGPLSGVASRITAFTALLNKNVFAVAVFIGALVGATVLITKMIKEAALLETQLLRLDFQVRAMGESFGFTTQELDAFAVQLGEKTLASATGVREAIGVLLTFRDVVPTLFKRVVEAAQDMVDTIGGDLPGATRRLARALSDPKTGLEALTRSGIVFTEQEKELINAFGVLNRKAEQQEFILLKLETAMGGNAVAAAQGLAGAWDTLGERFIRFLQEAAKTGGVLEPLTNIVNKVSDSIRDLLDNQMAMISIGIVVNKAVKFTTFIIGLLVDGMKFAAFAAAFFAGRAALGLVITVLGKYKIVLSAVTKVQAAFVALTLAHPFVIIGAGIAAAIGGIVVGLAKYTTVLDGIIKKSKDFAAEFDISGKIKEGMKRINKALTDIGIDPIFLGEDVGILPNFEADAERIAQALDFMRLKSDIYMQKLKERGELEEEVAEKTKKSAKIIDEARIVTEKLAFAKETLNKGLALEKKRNEELLTPERLLEKQLEALKFRTEELGVSDELLARVIKILTIESEIAGDAAAGFNTKLVQVTATTESMREAGKRLNEELKREHRQYRKTAEGVKTLNENQEEAVRVFNQLQDVVVEGTKAQKKAFETLLSPMEAFREKQMVVEEGVRRGAVTAENAARVLKALSLKYRLLQATADGFQITQFKVSSDMRVMNDVIRETNLKLKTLSNMFLSGEIGAKEFNERSKALVKTFKQLDSAVKTFASTVASGFARAAVEGGKLSQVIADIGKQLFQAAIQALIFNAITGAFSGGGTSNVVAANSGSNLRPGSGAAHGGRVFAGHTTLVGERGPELFTPSRDGMITPNNRLGGGGNTIINIDARGATPGMEGRIAAAIRMSENRAVARARVSIRNDNLRR